MFIKDSNYTIWLLQRGKELFRFDTNGVGIGYGGEGPRTLHKCILIFDDTISKSFRDTPIHSIIGNWTYKPGSGFAKGHI